MKRLLCLSLILLSLVSPFNAHASAFNPNTILSDDDFFRTDEMSADDVQFFLTRKGSALASMIFQDSTNTAQRAADIIYQSAFRHGINPKVLLVLLQKEQSLIENPNPSQYSLDWATGFARCDSCLASDLSLAKYKGFATQVERAAWRKAYYTTHWNEFQSRPQKPVTIDGFTVVPENAATAALYNYTPHLQGNYSFWKLWNRYFSRSLPDGSVVQNSSDSDIWLIKDGKRRIFVSLGAFLSRKKLTDILPISKQDLEEYAIGDPIKFPLYALLQNPSGAVFLYTDEGLYGIPSRAIFRSIGFNPDEVMRVSDQDLVSIRRVGLLMGRNNNPIGELAQNTHTGGVYYITNSYKHPILERAVLEANFPIRRIKPLSPVALEKYQNSDPIRFEDGTLVTEPSSTAVFVISNGLKRPIAGTDTFATLGYRWENIIRSNGKTLELHQTGPIIDLGKVDEDELPPQLAQAL